MLSALICGWIASSVGFLFGALWHANRTRNLQLALDAMIRAYEQALRRREAMNPDAEIVARARQHRPIYTFDGPTIGLEDMGTLWPEDVR
jgi:uncharacterized membrane protein YccC